MPAVELTDEHRARALESRRTRNDVRGYWLALLADGNLTIPSFLAVACEPDGEPLRAVKLSTVLAGPPGRGDTSARNILDRLGLLTGLGERAQKLNVAWVVDPRARGRLSVLADALVGPVQPWPGFPYAGPPATTEAGWDW